MAATIVKLEETINQFVLKIRELKQANLAQKGEFQRVLAENKQLQMTVQDLSHRQAGDTSSQLNHSVNQLAQTMLQILWAYHSNITWSPTNKLIHDIYRMMFFAKHDGYRMWKLLLKDNKLIRALSWICIIKYAINLLIDCIFNNLNIKTVTVFIILQTSCLVKTSTIALQTNYQNLLRLWWYLEISIDDVTT